MSFYYGNTIHLLFSLRSFRKHRKSSSTLNVQLKSVAKILLSVILVIRNDANQSYIQSLHTQKRK